MSVNAYIVAIVPIVLVWVVVGLMTNLFETIAYNGLGLDKTKWVHSLCLTVVAIIILIAVILITSKFPGTIGAVHNSVNPVSLNTASVPVEKRKRKSRRE